MPEDQNDQTATETTETEEVKAPEVKTEDVDNGEDDSKLPEWARNKLTKANAEAAKYRTELRAAEAALSSAKTPEEHEAALSELRNQVASLESATLRSEAARKHNLPDELVARLQGSNAAELEADAALLAALVVKAPSGSRRAHRY